MIHHSRVLAAALLFALAPAARAQSGDEWRAEVDRLLDRWADEVGPSRLVRARDLLAQRAASADDCAALVDLARVELALERPQEAMAATDRARDILSREEAAERAGLARTNEDRVKNGLPPLEPGPEALERRSRALAVEYLAAADLALVRARALEGEKAEAFLLERQQELLRLRQTLLSLAGEGLGGDMIRQETQRRRFLRSLDRLGREPRPIGQPDAAGQPIDLKAYRGKVLVVVFWSQALGEPEALLELDAVLREQKEGGLEVLGVCLDAPGGPASRWLAEHQIAWRQVFTNDGLISRDARAWEVTAVPSGVAIDHTGKVRWVDPWQDDLRLVLGELLRRRAEALAAAQRGGW